MKRILAIAAVQVAAVACVSTGDAVSNGAICPIVIAFVEESASDTTPRERVFHTEDGGGREFRAQIPELPRAVIAATTHRLAPPPPLQEQRFHTEEEADAYMDAYAEELREQSPEERRTAARLDFEQDASSLRQRMSQLTPELEDAFILAAADESPLACAWPDGVVTGRTQDWRHLIHVPIWPEHISEYELEPTGYSFSAPAVSSDGRRALIHYSTHRLDGRFYGAGGYALLVNEGGVWRVETDAVGLIIN